MTSVTPTSASHITTTKMNKRRLIDDPLFVASFDRTNTTPRQLIHMVARALKVVGVNVNVNVIRTIDTLEPFRRHVKTFLFRQSYCN